MSYQLSPAFYNILFPCTIDPRIFALNFEHSCLCLIPGRQVHLLVICDLVIGICIYLVIDYLEFKLVRSRDCLC